MKSAANTKVRLRRSIGLLAASLLAVGFEVGSARAQGAGVEAIESAIERDSPTAIIAEIERAENLVCGACIPLVRDLLDDDRQEVREVAAWWFARRAAQRRQIADNAIAALAGGDSIAVRNSADILGVFRHPEAIPALVAALGNGALTPEARAHTALALGTIGHPNANPALASAMGDASPEVKVAALNAWSRIRGQADAAPALVLVWDSDATVRRKAAAVIGSLRDPNGREGLEARLAEDEDSAVRRNAAWALGRIGDLASRPVLIDALDDPSGLVRLTAKVALSKLR